MLSVVKDRVRLAGAKNTTLLKTVTHIVSILANVIALNEVYQPRPQVTLSWTVRRQSCKPQKAAQKTAR